MFIMSNLIIYKNKNTNTVVLSLVFKVGSINENSKNSGLTNLCEHLFFRHLNSSNMLKNRLNNIGASLEATTYHEFVRFYISVLPQFTVEAAEILYDILRCEDWTEDDLCEEKNVIRNKLQNSSVSYDEFVDRFYFGNNKYSRPILGDIETLDQLTILQANSYKNKYFTDDNCCLIITGGIFNRHENQIREMFSFLQNSGEVKNDSLIRPKNLFCRTEKDIRYIKCPYYDSDVQISFDVNNQTVPLHKLILLNEIIGASAFSRLPYELVTKQPLTDSIYSECNLYNSFSRIKITYSVNCHNLPDSFEEISAILLNQITEDELRSAKYAVQRKFYSMVDSNEEYNFNIGWHNFVHGNDYSVNGFIENVDLVNIQDMVVAFREVFKPDNISGVIYYNSDIISRKELSETANAFRKSCFNAPLII